MPSSYDEETGAHEVDLEFDIDANAMLLTLGMALLQALVDVAKQQLMANRTQLEHLSSKLGLPIQENPCILEDFSEALASWDQQQATGLFGCSGHY